jgi:hypothetical protein
MVDSRCNAYAGDGRNAGILFAIPALTYVFAPLANGAQLIQRSFAIALMVGSSRYGSEQLAPVSCHGRGIGDM